MLDITVVDNLPEKTEPSPGDYPRPLVLRLAAGAILLVPAVWFTWLTVDGLDSRRQFRTDLAELTHVRYGLLSAESLARCPASTTFSGREV